MAERATAAGVAADMKPPNYRGAVQRLRGIAAKKARIAGVNGEISGIYDTVEGFKVNKKAARIFLTMDALEPDERQDIWRSLIGLIEVAEWDRSGDLVDEAEGGDGNIVTPNFGQRSRPASENAAGEDIQVDEAMRQVEEMRDDDAPGDDHPSGSHDVAGGKPKRLSPAEARKRAQEHFGEGKAPPTSDVAEPEPYVGDDSDLAGGADNAEPPVE
jgi:hypothetical protein